MQENAGPSMWLHVSILLRDVYGTPFVWADSKRPGTLCPVAFIEVPAAHYLMLACNDAKAV